VRISIILLGLPLLMYLYVSALYMGWHLPDPAWLPHAKNHLVRAMFGGVGMALVGLMIVLIPLRRGQVWAWWALLVIGFFTFGGFWLSLVIAEFAQQSELFKVLLVNALSLTSYIAGLWCAWNGLKKSSP